jgi:hypothetical protein
LRTQEKIEKVVELLKTEWELSNSEEDILHSVLTLIGNKREKQLKQLSHLLNEEEEELLETLYQRGIERYACYNFDLVSSHSEVDLVDALEDLNYDFTSEVTDEEMIESLEDDGWVVTREGEDIQLSNFDYVDNLLFKDIYDKFESADMIQRKELRDKFLNL